MASCYGGGDSSEDCDGLNGMDRLTHILPIRWQKERFVFAGARNYQEGKGGVQVTSPVPPRRVERSRAGSTRHSNYLSNFEKEEEEQRTELLEGCGGKAE